MDTNLLSILTAALAAKAPPPSVLAEWGPLFGFLGAVFAGIMVYANQRLKGQQELAAAQQMIAAAKVAEVATVLKLATAESTEKLNAIAQVADATLTHVNSALGLPLRLNAEMSARIADLTKGTPAHEGAVKEAEEAQRHYEEHQAGQAKVDSNHPGGVAPASPVTPTPFPPGEPGGAKAAPAAPASPPAMSEADIVKMFRRMVSEAQKTTAADPKA